MLAPLVHAPALARGQDAPDSSPQPPASLEAAIHVLTDPARDRAGRVAAAEYLLNLGTNPAIAAVKVAIARDEPPGTSSIAAEAVARLASPPETLVQVLAVAAKSGAEANLPSILGALSRWTTRDAVAGVVSVLTREPPPGPEVQRAACGSLAAQTGQTDFGNDPALWLSWWENARKLNRADWAELIAEGQARAARRAALRAQMLADRLLDTYRRLHASVSEGEPRWAILAELIRSDEPELVRLGFDLSMRTLLNARPLGDDVAAAAASRLTDPLPEIRAGAARLIDRLDKPELADAASRALQSETDGAVAGPLLRFLSRQAGWLTVPQAMSWLDREGPAADASVEALLALAETGALERSQHTESIRRTMRERLARPDDGATPAAVRLLVRIEGSSCRDVVLPLLKSDRAEIAQASAEALSVHEWATDELVAACRENRALVRWAIASLELHRPTAEGIAQAENLVQPDDTEAVSRLIAFARNLPPAELLRFAARKDDPVVRERYLAHVATHEFLTGGWGRDTDDRVLAVKLLARTRLDIKDPEGALAAVNIALDTYGPEPEGSDAVSLAALLPLRVHALLWLNRVDEAIAISRAGGAFQAAWLDALDDLADLPHAPHVRRAFMQLFNGDLSGDAASRLAAIDVRIAEAEAQREREESELIVGPPRPGGS